MQFMYIRTLTLPALLALIAMGLFGQADTGTLLGTVVDPSQAIVPGATVTLRNTETGKITTAKTDKDGVFQFPSTLVGSYHSRLLLQVLKLINWAGLQF